MGEFVAAPTESNFEGIVPLPEGNVWYESVGLPSDTTPLVIVHGGPGYTDYLDTLKGLANYGRPTVLYDQLGCGKSDRPEDPALWTLERSVKELEQVIGEVSSQFGNKNFHLLGHSFGATVVAEYLLRKEPDNVSCVILASPLLNTELYIKDTNKLINQLPDPAGFRRDIAEFEKNGTEGTPQHNAFQRRVKEFENLHTYGEGAVNHPAKLAADESFGEGPYLTMWGPSEFMATGNLVGLDLTKELRSLHYPILYTGGELDAVVPERLAFFRELTPGSEVVIFNGAAHMPHLEQTDLYNEVVERFLRENEVETTKSL